MIDIDRNEIQRKALKRWLPNYTEDKIEDLLEYISRLRQNNKFTESYGERLVLRKMRSDMGATDIGIYEDIPKELRDIE